MVTECHVCEQPLSDQDVVDAGMEEICHQCWYDREREVIECLD